MPYPTDALFIQDGNALFHAMTNLPPTFGDICLHVLDQMIAKKTSSSPLILTIKDSIKAQERSRRGSCQRYIIDGPSTRKPAEFKLFLANEDKKKQLCDLLLRVWGSNKAASRLNKSGMSFVVMDGKAYQLRSTADNVNVII